MLQELRQHLVSLQKAIKRAEVFSGSKSSTDFGIVDFEKRKKDYYERAVSGYVKTIKKFSSQLPKLAESNKGNETVVYQIQKLINDLDNRVTRKEAISQLMVLSSDVSEPVKEKLVQIPENLPEEIAEDVLSDLNEVENCYNSKCYRSVAILCGRLLETALHRKYYEMTGKDLLEKSPGIGLGKIIAKLDERNVKFDPGITQQIHLINQVRISSVHKKQEPFLPSQNQAKAMVLYTMDVLNKIFRVKQQ